MMETVPSHAPYLKSTSFAHNGKYYKAPFRSKWFKTYFASCSSADERNTSDAICSFIPLLHDSHSACSLWFFVPQCVLNYSVVMKTQILLDLFLTPSPNMTGSFGDEMCTVSAKRNPRSVSIVYSMWNPHLILDKGGSNTVLKGTSSLVYCIFHAWTSRNIISFPIFFLKPHQLLCLDDNNKEFVSNI